MVLFSSVINVVTKDTSTRCRVEQYTNNRDLRLKLLNKDSLIPNLRCKGDVIRGGIANEVE